MLAGLINPRLRRKLIERALRTIRGDLDVEGTLTADIFSGPYNGLALTPTGRLTTESGVAASTTDRFNQATLYYMPYKGNVIPIYNGTLWTLRTFAELSLALSAANHASGSQFDLFIVDDNGSLRLATGPAWSTGTARGTGAGTTELVRLNGLWLNNNAITVRYGSGGGDTLAIAAQRGLYVGSFRAAANGDTHDSLAFRFLWGAYNRIARPMLVEETANTWTYSTATFMLTGIKIRVFSGLSA